MFGSKVYGIAQHGAALVHCAMRETSRNHVDFVFFAPAALSTRIYLVRVEGNESPKVSQGVGPARETAFARYLVDLVYR